MLKLTHKIIEPYINSGLIRRSSHKEYPYTIFNYTAKCQADGAWDAVTLQTRGLVLDDQDNIIARPFPKFFNYGETGYRLTKDNYVQFSFRPKDYHGYYTATHKMDGSLGILYPAPDGSFAVASRGSFHSDQAEWATNFLKTTYGDWIPNEAGWTYLFEIIYPENRIVVDYGDVANLILIGIIDKESGFEYSPSHLKNNWPGTTVVTIPNSGASVSKFLDEQIAASPSDGTIAEGIVIRLSDQTKLKVKYTEYVRIHKLVFGLNTKVIWEHLAAGQSFAEIMRIIPDPFRAWLYGVQLDFKEHFGKILEKAKKDLQDSMGTYMTRKEMAEVIKKCEYPHVMFKLLDEQDPSELIWKMLRPPQAQFYSSEE